jgi:GNAT superfamily N-acetyltransferase
VSGAGRGWKAAPYEISDLQPIAGFFKRNYTGPGTYGTAEYFTWKVVENIFSPGIINLARDGEKIICTMSLVPKSLYFLGERHIVGEIGDIYTEPDYQRQGLFALLAGETTREALGRGISFIYGLPNEQARPGWEKRANFKTVSGIGLTGLVFPLDITAAIQNRSGSRLLGGCAASLHSTLLSAWLVYKKSFNSNAAGQVEEIEELPEDWDEFWEEARTGHDFILCRDRKAMGWRFFANPEKYRLLLLREKGRIAGYIVCRTVCDPHNTVVHVADYLAVPGREGAIGTLLLRICREAAQSNAAKISAWCPKASPYFRVFRRSGFLARNEIPLIIYRNDFSLTVEERCRSWHFTVGDSDNV